MDIWRAAKLLVDQHGAGAPIRAAQRADELLAAGDIEVGESDAAILERHGWQRCGAGDGRPRVRWPGGERHATFVDNHLFEVQPGQTLAVEEHEARLLVARG